MDYLSYATNVYFQLILQDKKISKVTERQLLKEEINSTSGPSLREVELDRINSLLLEQDLTVKVVASDGHCLYRCTNTRYCSYIANYSSCLSL
jgi:hypothetical protein